MRVGVLRNVAVLALGSGLAQVVALAASPLVARLYSPADYAALTMFLTLSGVLIPFACGKYEVAIVVAGTERHASDLTALSLSVAFVVSLALLMPIAAAREWVAGLLGCQDLGLWLIAVPAVVLLGAVAMVARYSANRRSEYGVISRYMLIQAVLSVSLNLLFGWSGWGGDGLIAANLLAVGGGTAWVLWRMRDSLGAVTNADASSLRHVAHKYRDFPYFNATSTILDSLTLAMPVFFISAVAGQEALGRYGFMMRVAQAPLGIIGGAITQVHLKQLSELVVARQPALAYLYRMAALLSVIVIPPSIALMLFAPDLFSVAFGAPWRPAGEYLVIVMPWIAIQFVVSSLSPAFGATGHNRLGAAWKALAFIGTLALFVVFPRASGVSTLLFALTIVNISLYFLYFLCIRYAVMHPKAIS